MQKTFLKILSVTLATAVVAHAQDSEPDFGKEERFHRIYKKYNEQPTSEEAWEKVLSGRKANSYSVQNKDTLWDISNTLFGDSNYWPKVWSYNTDDIQNPHEINPQQSIKFYPGTMSEAPTVGLADKDAPAEEMPSHVLEKNEAGELESIKIPPPKRKSRPLVKKLPESLPIYRMKAVNKPKVDFEVSGSRVVHPAPPKYISAYVSDNQVESLGEIVEMEYVDEQTAGDHQLIIVRVSNAANKTFTVVKDNVKISDPTEVFGNKGYVIEVQGEIELRERVNESENLFRALVKKSIQPLEVGAKLVPGSIKTFDSAATGISTSVQSKVVGGEYQRFDHRMFGADNIIFLSAGAKEGLQLGSTLQIFQNERVRNPKTKAISNDRVIGQVKIIKLSDHFATGYVLDSTSDILIGDYAGGSLKASAPQGSSAAVTDDSGALDFAPEDNNGGGSSAPSSDDDLQL